MAITGIERIVYCVDDVALSTDYFVDFGLHLRSRDGGVSRFDLPDNSRVYIHSLTSNPIPGSEIAGKGVHEVVWGVDTAENFADLVAKVSATHEIRHDDDGIAHFVVGGLPMGLRLWTEQRALSTAPDPVNSPGNHNRMNVHRRWIHRAFPKFLSHLGYAVPDKEATASFLIDVLGFRISDRQREMAIYLRCDGTYDHHNIALINASFPLPGMDGKLRFHHTNYAVTDLDEIMAGKTYIERRSWPKSALGLGRHRIASSLFCYFENPAGGEAEYGADYDVLDDGWVPRDFDPMFGLCHWMHNEPEWFDGANWDIRFADGLVPAKGSVKPYERK